MGRVAILIRKIRCSQGNSLGEPCLLSRANARARKGILWDMNGDGSLNSAETILRNQINALFGTINYI